MKATFLKGVALGAVVSLATLMGTAAFAGTGVGSAFNLGAVNRVNANTDLSGSTNGKQLQVTNTNTGASAGGIGISVAAGKAPLTVNSATQVKNLNANYLQGMNASQFVHGAASVKGWRLNVPFTGLSGLGSVGSFGGMNAYCETGGFASAGVTFDTTDDLEVYWPNLSSGSYSFGSTFTIAPDKNHGYATVQLVSATGIANVTIAYGSSFNVPNSCDFYVQVTESKG